MICPFLEKDILDVNDLNFIIFHWNFISFIKLIPVIGDWMLFLCNYKISLYHWDNMGSINKENEYFLV